jgi:hypothetical protein
MSIPNQLLVLLADGPQTTSALAGRLSTRVDYVRVALNRLRNGGQVIGSRPRAGKAQETTWRLPTSERNSCYHTATMRTDIGHGSIWQCAMCGSILEGNLTEVRS